MKKSMIEYIIETTDQNLITQRTATQKKANNYERLHIKIDDQLCYCEKCKRIWKKNRKMYARKIEFFPKNHIPTIGKKRKQCPHCKEKNKNG